MILTDQRLRQSFLWTAICIANNFPPSLGFCTFIKICSLISAIVLIVAEYRYPEFIRRNKNSLVARCDFIFRKFSQNSLLHPSSLFTINFEDIKSEVFFFSTGIFQDKIHFFHVYPKLIFN